MEPITEEFRKEFADLFAELWSPVYEVFIGKIDREDKKFPNFSFSVYRCGTVIRIDIKPKR